MHPQYTPSTRRVGPQPQSTSERFWKYVRKTETCWLWIGARAKFGYGVLQVGSRYDGTNRVTTAHRISYEIANGPIIGDWHVCHHCDTPPCVNPEHLFLGTARDNMRDAASKGRTQRLVGEQKALARTTDEMVREIRRRYAAGGISQSALGRELGIPTMRVHFIVHRRSWRHVQDD